MVDPISSARVYLRLAGASIRSQASYRLSFALQLVFTFLLTFLDFLAILVLFSHLDRLAGWSLAEVAFLYGTASVSFAVCDVVVGNLDLLPQMIREGSIDTVLVRPIASLAQVVTTEFGVRRFSKVAQGLLVLVIAVVELRLRWDGGRLVVFAAMMVSGPLIFGAIWVIAATHAFWTIETGEVTNAFSYGGNLLTTYPLGIFGTWLRDLILFVVPLAFVNYLPSLYILRRQDTLGAPAWLELCSPVVAIGLVIVATATWRLGIRHYRSTGS